MGADRDILFGLLALRNGLIDDSKLADGIRAWIQAKDRPLADHLVALGHVTEVQRPTIEAMATIHIEAHEGQPAKSLATLTASPATRSLLSTIGDAEIDQTLAYFSTPSAEESDRGLGYRVGPERSQAGRFRILRPHARGGLGAVHVALDEELHREVALKQILEKHADDPVSRARFLLEAEVTGGLEHPGIVPVYGLGMYADGRPYYAMRFIRGDSLKEAADAFHSRGGEAGERKVAGPPEDASGGSGDPGLRSLELRKLLLRFLDVCNAIEYAHSRGVLHRDIKPGNIIVGAHGETLVVDWGLAKATGRADGDLDLGAERLAPASASGSAETLPGRAMGTPGFMSPEQAEGDLEHLGPRSDVYSLGATLYYLLTGRPPFEGKLDAILSAVQAGELAPPRRWEPTIDRALEAVCLKAMARRREDRYASAKQLADDVERWMADEPVSAWREPVLRRARRWAKRHRTAVTAAVAALLAGVVGLSAVAAVQTEAKRRIAESLERETLANEALGDANRELSRSRQAVQARYDLAIDAIKTFHTGVSEDFLLREDKFKSLRNRLLKSASDFYGKLASQIGKDADAGSRRALADANFELAGLTAKVGRNADALAAYRAVLASRRELAADPGASAADQAEAGRSLTEIAALLDAAGKTDEALAAYKEGEESLVSLGPKASAAVAALAAHRSRMGGFLTSIGKNDDALAAYRSARADQEKSAQAPGATPRDRYELADTINRIGRLLANTGRPDEALESYTQALEIRAKLVADFPEDAEYRNALSASYNNLALIHWKAGRFKEAEDQMRKSLAIREKLSLENPAVTEFRKQLQASHFNLANLLRQIGRLKDAEELLRTAVGIEKGLVDDNPSVPEFRRLLALNHQYLATTLKGEGKIPDAESEFRTALAGFEEVVRANPAVTQFRSDLGSAHGDLAVLLAESGRTREAEAEFRADLENIQELVDANPKVTEFRDRLATGHVNLGELLSEMGKSKEAEREYESAQGHFRALAENNPTVTYYRNGLAYTLVRRGLLLFQARSLEPAGRLYAEAVDLYQALLDKSPKAHEYADGLAAALTRLADVRRLSGKPLEARETCDRAVKVRERLLQENPKSPAFSSGLAFSLRRRGLARRDMNDLAGAAEDTQRASDFWERLASRSGEDQFECACAHATLAGLAGKEGSPVAADQSGAQADRAIELLRSSVSAGYRNVDSFRSEQALDPLRKRNDFTQLLEDLERKASAAPK